MRHPEDAQGLLLVDLPPQSFGEEVFLLDEAKAPGLDLPFGFESKDQVPLLPSARVRMSGPSRLGYCVRCVSRCCLPIAIASKGVEDGQEAQ